MFLSRLIWLFRSPSGEFLSKVLNCSTSQLKSLARHHHQYQYMTTIEQIQSAFDIADTDGDGYLNWSEAIEAVQALWIEPTSIMINNNTQIQEHELEQEQEQDENVNNSNNGPNYFDFLWYDSPTLVKNQQIEKLNLTFSLDEFRLVCSQMIAPPPLHITSNNNSNNNNNNGNTGIQIPSECLKRSLESLLISSTTTWYFHFTENLRKSFRFELLQLFPIENFHTSSIENKNNDEFQHNIKNFLMKPNFKNQWKTKIAVLDGYGEQESEIEENVEKVNIPSKPSKVVSQYLKSITFLLYHTSLSIDTTLQLNDTMKINLPIKFQNDSTENKYINIKSLWEYNKLICYNLTLNIFEEEFLHRHQQLSHWIDHLPSPLIKQLQQQFKELLEEYYLQMLFDIMLCVHSFSTTKTTNNNHSITAISSINSLSYDTYYNSMDPVNISFLLPFIEEEYQQYLQQHNLFLPGSDKRINMITNLIDSVGKNINVNSNLNLNSNSNNNNNLRNQETQSEELMKSLFALYTPSNTIISPGTINKGNKANTTTPVTPTLNNRFEFTTHFNFIILHFKKLILFLL